MVKFGTMVLMLRVITGETYTPGGKKVHETKWIRADGDTNIGSCVEPLNKDIIEFKWVEKNPLQKLF